MGIDQVLRSLSCLLLVGLAACAPGPGQVAAVSTEKAAPGKAAWRGLSAPERLLHVTARVGPSGEAVCRRTARHVDLPGSEPARNCAFVIVLDSDRNLPANAAQGVLPDGRPLVAFTFAMVERAANEHELALVLGHEMAHHIADHAAREARRVDKALAGVDRALAGEGEGSSPPRIDGAVRRLSPENASDRAFLRGFEFEADRLGAEIAVAAGYDPVLGLKIIGRIDGPAGAWFPRDYYPSTRAREEAVLDALAGRSASARPR